MNFEQFDDALAELDRLSYLEARMQVFRDISSRQQLEILAQAITHAETYDPSNCPLQPCQYADRMVAPIS